MTPATLPGLGAPTAYLPEGLDPSCVPPGDRDYARWAVSAVVLRQRADRDEEGALFVPLSSEYLRAHLPSQKYAAVMTALKKSGALECDDRYYFGRYAGGPGKCRCYRLGEGLRGGPVRPQPLAHPELLRNIARFHRQERDAVTDPLQRALRDWHDRVEVLPDAPRGAHTLLDRMLDGERRFKVCDQGRVHTNVANLPRQYRQFVRVNGRELDQNDVAASQPVLLSVLLEGGGEGLKVEEGVRRSLQAVLAHCSVRCLSVFRERCLDGTVYDGLAARTGYTRDAVKAAFLAVIYGFPEDMGTRVGEALREAYPGVFHAVAGLNQRLGHGGLPRLLQALESEVMIRRVAGRLLRELPGVPLLTVHDCVVVPPEFAPAAAAVVREEWRAAYGLEPLVKQSGFTAPQAPRERKDPLRTRLARARTRARARARLPWVPAGGGAVS